MISVFCALEMIQLDETELFRNESSNASKKGFHLYLLKGQSNMAGRAFVESIHAIKHPRVMMLDKNQQWVSAMNMTRYP